MSNDLAIATPPVEEYTHDEIQELLLNLQYSLQEAAPGNQIVENFCRLGKLHITSAIPTAAVTVDHDGQIFLMFSPKFVQEILKKKNHTKILEIVLMHEALHVILEHISRKKHRNPMLWNIACDAIVNTMVLNIFSDRYHVVPNLVEVENKALTHNNFVAQKNKNINQEYVDEMNSFFSTLILPYRINETNDSCYISCAEELYERLLDNCTTVMAKDLKTLDDHSGWDKSGEGKGKKKSRQQEMSEDQLKEQLKNALEGTIKADKDALDKISGGKEAGKIPCGEFRELGINVVAKRLPWDKMLKNFIASRIDEYVEECWHNPSRKLRLFYPGVVLPNEFEVEDREKLLVLIAVDTSGSMDGETLKKVQGVLSVFPADKVDYTAVSFDTQIYPIDSDITKVTRFRGGGGTSFQDVAEHAHKLPTHPDVVIMITDGYDSPPKLQMPNRWLWLLVPGGHHPGGRIGTVLNIQ